MHYRTEHDTLGAVKVPADKYWGAQTQRSLENFQIGPQASMPVEIIHAFGYLKFVAGSQTLTCSTAYKNQSFFIANDCIFMEL